ncbi:MAG: arylesterase [Alphaproteobacteria bacterium]
MRFRSARRGPAYPNGGSRSLQDLKAFLSNFNSLCLVAALLVPAALQAAAEPVRIVALGDSLTAGYGLKTKEAFPARLEEALRSQGFAVEVLNAGVSGDTTAGGRARLDWVLKERPDLVIVELGSNDGLRGFEPAETFQNLDAILTRLKAAGVVVVLTGMRAPPNLGREYEAEFQAIFPRLAAKHGVAFYPFFLEGVAARAELNQADGMHPNARGVEAIVERILPFLLPLLRASGGTP